MDASTIIRQSTRSASRVVEGSAVVIVIDEQKLHTLNEVGTFVWSSAGPDGRAIEAIVDAVVQEFEVDADTATRDVVGFAKQLLQLGAFEVKEAS